MNTYTKFRTWKKWESNLRALVVTIAPPTPVTTNREGYEAGWRDAMFHVANYTGIRAAKCDGHYESLDDIRLTEHSAARKPKPVKGGKR
jgi:hypothetical protein